MTKKARAVPDTVGARIRRARAEAGMTQHDLAEAVGVRSQTIYRYEQGMDPGSATAVRIARALGVSLQWILCGEPLEFTDELEAFLKTPLGRTATNEEKEFLASIQIPNRAALSKSLYARFLLDLRAESEANQI